MANNFNYTPDKAPYIQLKWLESETDPSSVEWVDFPSDPEASPDQRTWLMVGVIATNQLALDSQRLETAECIQAVAFRYPEDVVNVGCRENYADFMGFNENLGEYRAGLRIGDGPLIAAMGLYVPSSKQFIQAQSGTHKLEPATTIEKLRQDYPDTPLV